MTELATTAESTIDIAALRDLVLSGRNANTIRAYATSLDDFAVFCGVPDGLAAMTLLLSLNPGHANAKVALYRAKMIEDGCAPATVNARLGAIRSVVKDARRFGLTNWALDVRGVKTKVLRDTAGPGYGVYRKMLDAASSHKNPAKAVRDRAILRLLHDTALRRKEVAGLDMSDVDLANNRVSVLRKCQVEKSYVTVPTAAMVDLRKWLEVRGGYDGPLFTNVARDPSVRGKRMTGEAINSCVVAMHGKTAGGKVRPHMLRHGGITEVCKRSNGDMAMSAAFAGHANMTMTARYIDNMKDMAGQGAELISE